MKKYNLTCCAVIFVISLLFSGCNKPDEDYPSFCRILQFTNRSSLGDYTSVFEYDAKGVPLRIRQLLDPAFASNYLFRHDKYNRITDVITYRSGNGDYGDPYESWRRLKYDAKNRVILDSSFPEGIIGTRPVIQEVPTDFALTTYKYDSKNRMTAFNIRYKTISTAGHFYYGNNGNLDSTIMYRNGERFNMYIYAKYDDRINLHRTHSLWQFLNRDYSVNNSLNTQEFNKYSLPTFIFYNSMKDAPRYFLDFEIGNLNIEYSCK